MGIVLKPDRLTWRLAIGTILLVVLPVTAGLILLSKLQLDRTLESRRLSAELETRILEDTLRHEMIEKDGTLIAEILGELTAQPEVRNVLILNHEGEVRWSGLEGLVGTTIARDSAACSVCHDKPPESREHWVQLSQDGAETLRTVRPIENRPECHGCHAPTERLNGILILDVDLEPVYGLLRRDTAAMLIGTAMLALLLIGGVGLLVRRLILHRLRRVSRAARAIAAGSLDERAPTAGGDVISDLGADFNAMADATDRLISEIRARQRQMIGVMNSLDDGLVVLDRDFRVVASNRSLCRRLGTHPEAIRGSDCRDTFDRLPCYGEPNCPASVCLDTGKLQRAVMRVPSPDGDAARVEEVYASPVFDDDGNTTHVVEIWRDISERVKEEERLAEIERLTSLGVLASGFSHEVNTPLASMLTCSESILRRLDGSGGGANGAETVEHVRQHAEIIRQQVARCRRLTEQFRRFSRGIPPTPEPLDLRAVVASVVALASPTARESRVTLNLEGDAPVPLVTANTEVVQHVVLNLLINAIQSCEDRGGDVAIRFVENSDIRLQIRDNGCGIPDRARQYLFEPFRSQKPRGTGLGLFLSRTFMQRFGGDVRLVDSRVGVGSCLEVIFPRGDGGASA